VALVVFATISGNTNMPLKDKMANSNNLAKRDEQLWVSVKTSSAVEGIRKPFVQSSGQLAAKHAEFVKLWRIAATELKRQQNQ
jgi:hypothetical protein